MLLDFPRRRIDKVNVSIRSGNNVTGRAIETLEPKSGRRLACIWDVVGVYQRLSFSIRIKFDR